MDGPSAKQKRDAGRAQLAKFRSKKDQKQEPKEEEIRPETPTKKEEPKVLPPEEKPYEKAQFFAEKEKEREFFDPMSPMLMSDNLSKIRALEQTNKIYINDNKALTLRLQALTDKVTNLEAQNKELKTNLETTSQALETTKKDKLQLQKDLSNAEKDKSDLLIKTSNLSMTVSTLTGQYSELQHELLKAKSSVSTLETALAPTQAELKSKEAELQQLSQNQKKLEHANQLLTTEKTNLLQTIKLNEENTIKKITTLEQQHDRKVQELQNEFTNISKNHKYQADTINNLMNQRRNVMLQLTNEVKRNGILVKENSELKQTLQVQQAIVQNLGQGLDEKAALALNQKCLSAIKIPAPILNPLTHDPLIPSQHPHPAPAAPPAADPSITPNKSDENIYLGPKGWLGSLPIIGRFWAPPVLKKTFEVSI